MLIVEVCQGPDCTGLGSGATILEIEELIQESHYQQHLESIKRNEKGDESENDVTHVTTTTASASTTTNNTHKNRSSLCVKEGGCRDLCTVGPNIRLLHKKYGSIESFHHINDTSKCNWLVQKAALLEEANNCDTSGDASSSSNNDIKPSTSSSGVVEIRSKQSHQSMMTRRAERMRWEALRNISRKLAKYNKETMNNNINTIHLKEREGDHNENESSSPNQQKMNSWKKSILEEELVSSSNAELSAARGNQLENDRVIRRQERLSKNVMKRLEKCFQYDSDSEDSDNDDDSSDGSTL